MKAAPAPANKAPVIDEAHVIDVRALIDGQATSRYQQWVIALCFLAVVADGMDVVIMGLVGPALREAWGWSNDQLAPVFSAALVGLALGALAGGPLGDRFGRRKLLFGCLLIFGLFTLLAPVAGGIGSFMAYRFIAGLAMGCIMPITVTMATEYAPGHSRAMIVSIVFGGFTIGSAGGGFLAAWLLPSLGWQSVFIVGGIVPIVLGLLAMATLPESLTFLVHRGGDSTEIRRIVERCAPGSTRPDSRFSVPLPPQAQAGRGPMQLVLNGHYRFGTLLVWGMYVLHLFLAFLLASWMPTMVRDSGLSLQQASVVTGMFFLGGPVGALLVGWLMDRRQPDLVVSAAYGLTAGVLVLLGQTGGHYGAMLAVAFLLGVGINGGGGLNALASSFFPLPARATGNSWMHGLGRLGAIASTFAGAWMLNAHWSLAQVSTALAVPSLLIATLLLLKWQRYRCPSSSSAGLSIRSG